MAQENRILDCICKLLVVYIMARWLPVQQAMERVHREELKVRFLTLPLLHFARHVAGMEHLCALGLVQQRDVS